MNSMDKEPRLESPRKSRRGRVGALCVALVATTAACDSADSGAKDAPFVKGCKPYVVYSQNRYQPYGTAVRSAPNVLAPKVASPAFAPNEIIAVDGYVHTGAPTYPTNPAPWNSDVWFHVANSNEDVWVSFPGVRGEPTVPDPTSIDINGGAPAVLATGCEATFPLAG